MNWLRDRELHPAAPAYEARLTLGLPAHYFGGRRGLRSLPFQAVRPVSRAYKAHPRTSANGRIGAATGNRTRIYRLATCGSTIELPPRIGGDDRTRTDIAWLQARGPPFERRPQDFNENRCGRLYGSWSGLPRTCRVDGNDCLITENEKPLSGGRHRRGSLILRSCPRSLPGGNSSVPMRIAPIGRDKPIGPRHEQRLLFGQTWPCPHRR